jgi:iron complex outermembrane receptor protein
MKKIMISVSLVALGLGVVLGDTPPLSAQESDIDEFTLEEITVTAQKREENQQKVAIAMDIFSAEDIKELGKSNIDEIIWSIPSALIQKSQDGYRISLRGLTDYSEVRDGLSTAVPAVAINTDGVYSARKDNAGALYDIERVEVLYGPQSTMYSSNSPGGIVNIITGQPKLDAYEVSGTLEYGTYNLIHTEGVMNAPLSDKTAIRAAFTTIVRDGYLSNGTENEDSKSARVRALLQPNDRLSFTISGELTKKLGGGFGGGVVEFVNQDDVVNPWTGAESNPVTGNDVTSKQLSGQMNWDTDLGALSLTPSYFTEGGVSLGTDWMSGDTTYNDRSIKERNIEFRMTSPEDFHFKWIAGFTYFKADSIRVSESETYLETGAGSYGYMKLNNTNKAIWANVTYPIMDRFRVTAGLRKSFDTYLSETGRLLGPDYVNLNVMYWALDTDGLMDYKFGFEYDLGENSMLYGDYATSYRLKGIGKTNLLKGETEALDAFPPEYLDAYSLGSKNRFFGNKLQVNASAYYYDYRNYEAGGEDAATVWFEDTNNNLQMDWGEFDADPWAGTVGDGYMMGFDLQTSAIITSNDMLNLSVSYETSEWTKLKFTYYYDTTLAVVDGVLMSVPHVGDDYTGKPMMNTPPWTVTLNYSHNFNLQNGAVIKANIISKYRTGYQMTWCDEHYPKNYQEDYHMEDVSATYSSPDGKWTLSAYLKNVFNYAEKRRYYGYPPKAGRPGLLWISDPRTYGFVLSVKY